MGEESKQCSACGRWYVPPIHDDPDFLVLCLGCLRRFPPSLVKAVSDDPWFYALRLTTGEIIQFQGASIRGDYVHLTGVWEAWESGPKEKVTEPVFPFDRGLDVRLSEIVWCCDAPFGS